MGCGRMLSLRDSQSILVKSGIDNLEMLFSKIMIVENAALLFVQETFIYKQSPQFLRQLHILHNSANIPTTFS